LVAAVVFVGLIVRTVAVLARPRWVAAGDAAEYLGQANLLAAGKGFIEPFVYATTHHAQQTAKLPPLYIMALALCSLVGFKSFLAHRIWSAIMGASAVALGAVVGREVAGPRVGLIAAVVLAIYPNVWMSDALGMSETLSPILVLLVLWAAYRLEQQATVARAAWLGVAIGAAALGRDELLLLAPLVLIPLAVGRGRGWGDRVRLLAAGGVACLAVVGPWVGYNLSRFQDPVLITDRLGATLAVTNCDPAWYGPLAGYWSFGCGLVAAPGGGDESVEDAAAAHHALRYVGDHLGSLPLVEAKRLGREFGLYQPFQQIRLDVFVEARPRFWAFAGLWAYAALAALAVPGAMLLRRRGTIVYPLAAVGAAVAVAALLTLGQTRFRASFEPVLVLLAAVAIERWLSGRWRDHGPLPVLADPQPAPAVSPAPSGPR
jgi:hypothetical protein